MKILISAHSLGNAAIGDMYLKEDNDINKEKSIVKQEFLPQWW